MIPLAPLLSNYWFLREKQLQEEQLQLLLEARGYRHFMALGWKELVALRLLIRSQYSKGLYSNRLYDLLCYTLRQRLFERIVEKAKNNGQFD